MREIEIKARVKDSTETLVALERAGVVLGKPKKQHDVVYSRPGAKDNDPGENWLRIRTEDDTTVTFTLKRSVSGELDSIEHETIVDSATELSTIIGYLGYELFSDLTKIRRKGTHGEMEICFDEVPNLGTFIEAELLCAEDVDHDTVVKELWDFVTQIGITKDDEETSGYDVLMRRYEGKGV